jgi:hypothetical protein
MDLSKYANLDPEDQEVINPAYEYEEQEYEEQEGHIIPYGFNGVFTKRENGSAILNGGLTLYSPSGIYPGNDSLSSDVVKSILKQSANLEVANIVTGFIGTEVGQNIDRLFKD